MKISLLLDLEPFYDILKETLSAYFFQKDGLQRHWDSEANSQSPSTILYVNKYLNCIFQPSTHFSTFRQIRKEFRTRTTGSFLIRMLQWLYVYLATTPYFSVLLSHHKMRVSPPLPLSRDEIILGGRTIIRIINPKQKVVSNILKSGCNLEHIQFRIALRQSKLFSFIPPILEEWQTGFSERYVESTPLNRLSRAEMNATLPTIYTILSTLSQTQTQTVSASDFFSKLMDEIRDPLFRNIAKEWTLFLKELPHPDVLPLCFSHGDFQPANLLLDASQKLWVIDWEGAYIRSQFYDSATFFLFLRHPQGLAKRIERLIQSDTYPWYPTLPYLSTMSPYIRFWIGLVILEHLVTVYKESLWFPAADYYPELYDFINELYQIKKVLTLG